MKKIFYVAAVALAFAACSKDEVKLDSLTVTPETVTKFTDEVLPELSVTGSPSDILMGGGTVVTWTSDKPEIITVDENGKIAFAVKDIENEETVTISASAAGKTATCVITVKPQIARYEVLDFTKEYGFKMLDRYVGATEVLKAGNYYQWGKNTPVAVAGDVKANANFDANWSANSKGFADWTKPENTPCPMGWGLPDAEQMKAIKGILDNIVTYELEHEYLEPEKYTVSKEEYDFANLMLNKMLLAPCGQFGHDGTTDIYLPKASYFWSCAVNEDGKVGTFENNEGNPLYNKSNPITLAFPVRCVKK